MESVGGFTEVFESNGWEKDNRDLLVQHLPATRENIRRYWGRLVVQ